MHLKRIKAFDFYELFYLIILNDIFVSVKLIKLSRKISIDYLNAIRIPIGKSKAIFKKSYLTLFIVMLFVFIKKYSHLKAYNIQL